MRGAVDAYLQSKRDRGLRESSVTRDRYHLEHVLELDRIGARPVRYLKPAIAEELYVASQTDHAVDTHRNGLNAAKAFGAWCAARGWLPANPFAALKGLGRRRRGKPQPRIDEARQLVLRCLEVAGTNEASIAALCAFLLGLRASEVTERDVRDLDDGGRLLWVPDSKTEAGRRCLEVPDELRPLLLGLADRRPPDAALFAGEAGVHRSRYWIYYHVRKLCLAAGIPKTSPQALRGLHATMAKLAGKTSHEIAAAMGHESPAITEAAYIDPVLARADRHRTAMARLGLGGPAPKATDEAN